MKNLFARFVRDEEGQDLIEYRPGGAHRRRLDSGHGRCRPTSTPSSARSARSSDGAVCGSNSRHAGAPCPGGSSFPSHAEFAPRPSSGSAPFGARRRHERYFIVLFGSSRGRT